MNGNNPQNSNKQALEGSFKKEKNLHSGKRKTQDNGNLIWRANIPKVTDKLLINPTVCVIASEFSKS